MNFNSKDIEKDKAYIYDILMSKGILEAKNAVIRQLNQENLHLGINNKPQNAERTNPKYKAMFEVIEDFKEVQREKDELFKQFVLNYKAFKEWLNEQQHK